MVDISNFPISDPLLVDEDESPVWFEAPEDPDPQK